MEINLDNVGGPEILSVDYSFDLSPTVSACPS